MTHGHDHGGTRDRTHTHGHAHHAHSHGHDHGGHGHDHGPVDPDIVESREGVRVLMVSLLILGATAIAQAIVVYLTSSVALLADTIHNVGDSLTSIPLAIAFILSRRPPSRRYGWGLGRTEDLAGLVIVSLIAFSGVVAFVESAQRLIHPHAPDHLGAGIAAGVLGFAGNELVAVYRIRQGRRMDSAALVADGQHARVDGWTSLSVAVGLALVALGVEVADPIIGMGIALVIARITWRAARDVGVRLLDGIDPATLEPVAAIVAERVGSGALHAVRGRWFGHVVHLEVEVDPVTLGAERMASLGAELERELRAEGTRVRRVAMVAAQPQGA